MWLLAIRSKVQITWLAKRFMTRDGSTMFFQQARAHRHITRKVLQIWSLGRWALFIRVGTGTFNKFDRILSSLLLTNQENDLLRIHRMQRWLEIHDAAVAVPAEMPSSSKQSLTVRRRHERARREWKGRDAEFFSIPPRSRAKGMQLTPGGQIRAASYNRHCARSLLRAHKMATKLAMAREAETGKRQDVKALMQQFLPVTIASRQLPAIQERKEKRSQEKRNPEKHSKSEQSDDIASVSERSDDQSSQSTVFELPILPYDALLQAYRTKKRIVTKQFLPFEVDKKDDRSIGLHTLPNLPLEKQRWLRFRREFKFDDEIEVGSPPEGLFSDSMGSIGSSGSHGSNDDDGDMTGIPVGTTGVIYSWQQFDPRASGGFEDDLFLWLDGYGARRVQSTLRSPIEDWLETKPAAEILAMLTNRFKEGTVVRVQPPGHEFAGQLGEIRTPELEKANPFVYLSERTLREWQDYKSWNTLELLSLNVYFPDADKTIPVLPSWVRIIEMSDILIADQFLSNEIARERQSQGVTSIFRSGSDRLAQLTKEHAIFKQLLPDTSATDDLAIDSERKLSVQTLVNAFRYALPMMEEARKKMMDETTTHEDLQLATVAEGKAIDEKELERKEEQRDLGTRTLQHRGLTSGESENTSSSESDAPIDGDGHFGCWK
jgi:hypothetical protein